MTPIIEERLFQLLDNPMTCPHGSPIPGTGATLGPDWVPLDTLGPDDRATVKFISEELEEDAELLSYLDRHNLRPGQPIRIAEKVPSTGLIAIDNGSETVSLGLPAASRIRVDPAKT
jgi:DtxR family Mn-dependent transcriptional regulator